MPAMLYRPPGLVDRVSAVIRAGATLACSVTTLVAGGRDVGIANVRVRAATAVASVPLVAERKLKVPAITREGHRTNDRHIDCDGRRPRIRDSRDRVEYHVDLCRSKHGQSRGAGAARRPCGP